MSDIESEFDMSGNTSYDVVILKTEKYEGIKTEIARLQEDNRKLREAVIAERARLLALKFAIQQCREGDFTDAQKELAESELRAEGVLK